jgi:hypothetical protein
MTIQFELGRRRKIAAHAPSDRETAPVVTPSESLGKSTGDQGHLIRATKTGR